MIRSVGKKTTINKYVSVEEIVTKEKITSISIRPESKSMEITIVLMNSKGEVVGEEASFVTDVNYDLLFSEDAFFDEGKQEGSYREVDLWKMIDKVLNELQDQTAR